MSIIKQLKFGDISRIASEVGVSAGYVQTALRGGCESELCIQIRQYAGYIINQYDQREEYLRTYFKTKRP